MIYNFRILETQNKIKKHLTSDSNLSYFRKGSIDTDCIFSNDSHFILSEDEKKELEEKGKISITTQYTKTVILER